jgi:hypothetical protein
MNGILRQIDPIVSERGRPMDRAALLKQLSDRKLEHWQSRGLSPVKARQLVAEKVTEWKSLSDEELQKLMEKDEAEY